MHHQLETLLEIQDLKTQRKELETAEGELQKEVFNLPLKDALAQLDEKIDEMVESLEPQVRNKYLRICTRHPRVVVPVIRGTCYGCFVAVATAVASDADRNRDVLSCENCGRFLYMID